MVSDQHREVIDRFTGPYAFLSNFHPCRVTFYGMIDASVERLKERIKLQIEQEQQNAQEVFDGPNEQDLDNMLDNLLIFDQ